MYVYVVLATGSFHAWDTSFETRPHLGSFPPAVPAIQAWVPGCPSCWYSVTLALLMSTWGQTRDWCDEGWLSTSISIYKLSI